MNRLNQVLDVICIVVSLFLIIVGRGNFGDYWVVYGWLAVSVFSFLIKKSRRKRLKDKGDSTEG